MIQFDPIKHEYRDSIGKYISVTTLISLYKNKFNKEREAQKYIENHPEYPMTLEQCLYAWDFLCIYSLDKGNYYHRKQEVQNLFLSNGLADDYVETVDLNKLYNGVYPELRLYNEEFRIAGHADRVDVDNGYIDIEDYKTYKVLNTKGFRGQKMSEPISHLDDCNFIHATIQLSFYAFLLEAYGYKPRKLKIHHKPFADYEEIDMSKYPFFTEEQVREPRIYEVNYDRELVQTLIQDYARKDKR